MNQAELYTQIANTVATITYADDGGPLRTIISGRRRHPTGRMLSIKAGHRSMPWESFRAELPLLKLCEACGAVHALMVQPHRLEMSVTGEVRKWVYFPDMVVRVDRSFADAVCAGTPFIHAVASWRPTAPGALRHAETVEFVIEAKDDDDPRMHDGLYREKLELARQAYAMRGWRFAQVVRSVDLESRIPIMKAIHDIVLDRLTSVGAGDVAVASDLIARQGGIASYGDLIAALGPAPVGRAKAHALHVRRVVAIELSKGISESSRVRLIADGGALI